MSTTAELMLRCARPGVAIAAPAGDHHVWIVLDSDPDVLAATAARWSIDHNAHIVFEPEAGTDKALGLNIIAVPRIDKWKDYGRLRRLLEPVNADGKLLLTALSANDALIWQLIVRDLVTRIGGVALLSQHGGLSKHDANSPFWSWAPLGKPRVVVGGGIQAGKSEAMREIAKSDFNGLAERYLMEGRPAKSLTIDTINEALKHIGPFAKSKYGPSHYGAPTKLIAAPRDLPPDAMLARLGYKITRENVGDGASMAQPSRIEPWTGYAEGLKRLGFVREDVGDGVALNSMAHPLADELIPEDEDRDISEGALETVEIEVDNPYAWVDTLARDVLLGLDSLGWPMPQAIYKVTDPNTLVLAIAWARDIEEMAPGVQLDVCQGEPRKAYITFCTKTGPDELDVLDGQCDIEGDITADRIVAALDRFRWCLPAAVEDHDIEAGRRVDEVIGQRALPPATPPRKLEPFPARGFRQGEAPIIEDTGTPSRKW